MDDADSLMTEAVAAARGGDGARALDRARRVVVAAPEDARLQRDAGLLLGRLGRSAESRAALERALALAPSDARAADGLGQAHLAMGMIAEAENVFRRAISLDPDLAGPHMGLGRVRLARGEPAAAVAAFEAGQQLNPGDPRGPWQLGLLYLEQGLLEAAVASLERAAQLAPRAADVHAALGLARQTAGELDGADAAYRAALAIVPRHRDALRGLARLADIHRRPKDGLDLLGPAVAQGNDGGLLSLYGRLLRLDGRRDEAISLLTARMGELHGTEGQMEVAFRLAELCDEAGDHERAFACARTANRLKGARFDPAAYEALIDRLLAAFSPAALRDLPHAATADERPVFVVGMPRSGTSLVEQILASHSAIHGAGELSDMGLLALSTARGGREYPESVAGLDAATTTALSQAYFARIDARAPGAQRVVDKMWQNFEYLGFIALLCPRARVVYCRRDPLDSGLSCYFQHFFGQGVPFAYDLAHIGRYYRQLERAMDHWRTVLDLPLLELEYESLVADPESEIRRLVEFTGLPWDPACLDFHETERAVRTASHAQVRQPMYASSVGRHHAYEQWLAPLREALAAG